MGIQDTVHQEGVEALLTDPRFELLPFSSFDDQLGHLPEGAKVAITSSPQQGVDTTVDLTEQAVDQGYEVIPHIGARYVRSDDHLDEIAGRLKEAGVSDIFVPGGDPEDPGAYESAYEMLVALDDLGYEFEEVGITGYPEGHHFIDDETLVEAMNKKKPYATYIVTQLCYDPQAIIDWTEELREERDVDLPIDVGIPGVMKYQKLIGISRKVGVGDSVRFLQKTTGLVDFVKQFISSRGKYEPDELIDGLAPYGDDPEYDFKGVHIYTFNRVPDTEEWRRKRLQ